jgi:D-alanyl-D-alanine-carboxypeptidase/D-alanyl-D-alanine-endopeptidase
MQQMVTAVRVICFTILLSAFPFRAAAEDFTNAIHAYLQQCIDSRKLNGSMVIGIVDEHGSRVVSYGKLDNGTGQEANGDTVFQIHSATGRFTKLLLEDMVERGEMKLEDAAAGYLPKTVKMPTRNGREITLRHLAVETSGMPDFADKLDSQRADDVLEDFTIEKMDAFVSGCQLTSDPGTTRNHGGVDLGLLGQAMALKAGSDFESLMAERIFRPLKMNSTGFTLTPELESRLAREHDEAGSGYVIPIWNWGALKPCAGAYSTANDLLKFVSADLGLAPSRRTPLIGKTEADFAYVPQGKGIVHTGGGDWGGGSYAGFDEGRHRGVVILSTAYVVRHDLGYFLLKSEWQSDRRPMVTNINPQVYGLYSGQYQPVSDAAARRPFFGHDDATISQSGIGIRREGDRLFAQAAGPNSSPPDELLPPIAGELLPESETRFFERLSGTPITFSRDFRGKVTGLTVHYQGNAFSYQKISEQPPKAPEPVKPPVRIKLDAKLLEACAGRYEFAPNALFPAGMKLTIWRDGDKLTGQGRGEKVFKGVFDIYPESETNFFDKFVYARFMFIKNDKGEVTVVIRRQMGQPDSEGRKLKD